MFRLPVFFLNFQSFYLSNLFIAFRLWVKQNFSNSFDIYCRRIGENKSVFRLFKQSKNLEKFGIRDKSLAASMMDRKILCSLRYVTCRSTWLDACTIFVFVLMMYKLDAFKVDKQTFGLYSRFSRYSPLLFCILFCFSKCK